MDSLRIAPDTLLDNLTRLDRHRVVVAVCVHGHEVSQSAAAQLRECGFDAYFLEGGMEAVRQDGAFPMAPTDQAHGA